MRLHVGNDSPPLVSETHLEEPNSDRMIQQRSKRPRKEKTRSYPSNYTSETVDGNVVSFISSAFNKSFIIVIHCRLLVFPQYPNLKKE
jgi:hypothetical protein